MQARLFAIARRFNPALASANPILQTAGTADVIGTLYALPLALAGIAGLAAVTDLALLRREGPVLLLFFVLKELFYLLRFHLAVELKPGVPAESVNTLDLLIVWSGALIFGPTALWIALLWQIVEAAWQWRQNTQILLRWSLVRNTLTDLAQDGLAGLVGLACYRAWGGEFPPQDLSAGVVGAALGATLVRFLLSSLILLPLFLQLNAGLRRVLGADYSQGVFLRFFAVTLVLPGLIDPFSVLAALLYARAGLGLFLFLVAGALLSSLLARQLSRTAERNTQRSRELDKLEQLGRAILASPPDGSALPDLLRQYVPGMFSFAGIEIRFFTSESDAPELVLHDPDPWGTVDPAVWRWARSVQETHCFPPQTRLPWSAESGHQGQLFAPITSLDDGSLLGGIFLETGRDGGEIGVLVPAVQSLAAQIALARHRAAVYAHVLEHQKVAQEMEMAEQIQASLLPTSIPPLPGWQLAVTLRSARQTSGDFYDLIALPNGRLGLVVADVADKGMGAALYMALSRTLLRTYALAYPTQPAAALRAAHQRLLLDTDSSQFVTVFYGVLEPDSGRLTYASAGHNPAYLFRPGDSVPVRSLPRTGIPMGLFEESTWEEITVEIAPGEVLVLYTDGVTEAQNRAGDLFGETRLHAAVRAGSLDQAGDLCTWITEALHQFADGAPQSDDITLLVAVRC